MVLHWSMLLRGVKHAWAKEDYKKVMKEAAKLRKRQSQLLEDVSLSSIRNDMLTVWESYAQIAFDPLVSHENLEQAIKSLTTFRNKESNEDRGASTPIFSRCHKSFSFL